MPHLATVSGAGQHQASVVWLPGTRRDAAPRVSTIGRVEDNDSEITRMLEHVYGHLRMTARKRLSERDGHTLQPTDLIHESYLKMLPQIENSDWEHCGGHKIGVAARDALAGIGIVG